MKIYFAILLILPPALFAQSPLNLDSINRIKHVNYEIRDAQSRLMTMYKESHFDTNRILVHQERWHYVYTDTGSAIATHYLFDYNPKDKLGNFYTEKLPHKASKQGYKKEWTKFKSYDHKQDRLWVKQYDAQEKLVRETENSFDKSGALVKAFSRDHTYDPPLSHSEEIRRNDAGLMVLWESFDDDGSGSKRVREMSWEYLQDTILLKNVGYVYNDWSELVNTYDKKSGLLEKSVLTYGYRGDNGDIKRNHRTETFYENGRRVKAVDYEYNKKISTKTYTYTPDTETEITSTKGKADVVMLLSRKTDAQGRLSALTKTIDGVPEYSEAYEFHENGALRQYTEIEYRNSGAHAKRINYYNEKGNLTRKELFIGDKLTMVDEYSYE